jgi:hypothetical protein
MLICYVRLTQGKIAIFDMDDWDLMEVKWHYKDSGRGRGYACRTISIAGVKTKQVMHRLIAERMGLSGMEVDHINNDPLDNRRSNLRVTSRRQNRQNSLKKGRRYRGTALRGDGKKWCAYIQSNNGKSRYLGSFDTERDAAAAYNVAAIEVYGEGAFQNDLS